MAAARTRRDVPVERTAARGLAQPYRHAPTPGIYRADLRNLRAHPRRVHRPGIRRRLRTGMRFDVGQHQPAWRVQSPSHPSARPVEWGLLCPHPGRLRSALPYRSALAGPCDDPVLQSASAEPPTPGRRCTTSRLPAGSSPFPDGLSTPRTRIWRARGTGRARPRIDSRVRAPRPGQRTMTIVSNWNESASASTSTSGAGVSTPPPHRRGRLHGRTCSRGEGTKPESDCARGVAFRLPRNGRLLAALEPCRRSGDSVATDAPARLRAMDAVAVWPALQRDPAHSLPCADFDSHEGSRL